MAMNIHELKFSLPLRIVGKVAGSKEIIIKDTVCSKGSLFHYYGVVRCGDDEFSCEEATILAFYMHEKEVIEDLYCRLNLVSHPYIMKSLGCEIGTEVHGSYIFLAFPRFEETLADYMDNDSRSIQFERFTELFIELIRCVVVGMLKLHSSGFYCPTLNGRSVAVVKENSSVVAKLWDFCVLEKGNEDAKDKDWHRLGYILKKTAASHKLVSKEIDDLFQNIKNGNLKGLDILKHSCLLTVRKKFENVLSLNTYTLSHHKIASPLPNNPTKVKVDSTTVQSYCNPSDKAKTIASFKNLLDCDVEWKSDTPPWLFKRIVELGFQLPKHDTLREFLWEVRCLIEHENDYVIKELITKISSWTSQFNEDRDLEHELRKAWALLFLYAQKVAASFAMDLWSMVITVISGEVIPLGRRLGSKVAALGA